MEAEPELHCIKSTGDGTVYPSAEPGEALLRREYPAVDLTAKEQDTCWKRRSFPTPEKEVKRDTGPVLFLSVPDGCPKAEAEKDLPGAPGRHPKTGCQDRADGISPEASTTREELLAYRTSLEERVQALTKERKRLYRSEPDSVRIGQITEELKPLRKDIRICIRIEQQSQDMEEKMRLAEQIQRQEEEQTEKNRKPRTESRYSLDGVDHGLRLSGTLAKHLAVFVAAVLKDQKKTRGKTRMVRMLKENKPLKFFTVPSDRLREFCSEGRKRGLLYVIIRDKKNPEMSEVMVFADDAAKVNRVMDKMNLDFVRSEVGEAVHEVTAGMEAPETEAVQETVQMPEGAVTWTFPKGKRTRIIPKRSFPNRKILSRCRKRGKRICPALPCTAEIFLPGRKKGLMQGRGNRSVPVSAGSWRTSNGRKQRNPRSGAGKRTVDQGKRRRKQERNER